MSAYILWNRYLPGAIGDRRYRVFVPPRPDPHAEWWTTSDVAAYLGVSVGTVSTYRARGQMPPPDTTLGRTRLWKPSRIVKWHATRPGRGGRPRKSAKQD